MHARSHVAKGLLTLAAVLTFVAVLPVLTHASDPGSANWTKLSPATSPSARVYSTMAYDPVSKKIVLFGGFGQQMYLQDTWTFDGTTWSKQQTPVAPPARTTACMAFDKRTHKLVMFGGFDGKATKSAYLNDTWLWDGATSTWTQATMKSPPPRASGPMGFTDPLTGRAMMFGGYDYFKPKFPVYSTTWGWTGTAWHKLHPATSPYPRGWGIAALDPVTKNVVLTGGDGDTIRTDNTWTWDGTNWTQLFPSTQIPMLLSAGIAFDADSQLVIAFGGWGASNGQEMNQTWSWDGTNWVLLNPAKSPSARDGLGMAYDPNNHQVVMFGGEVAIKGKQLRDTWKWTGK
jgi:Galactose oxidase, central domain